MAIIICYKDHQIKVMCIFLFFFNLLINLHFSKISSQLTEPKSHSPCKPQQEPTKKPTLYTITWTEFVMPSLVQEHFFQRNRAVSIKRRNKKPACIWYAQNSAKKKKKRKVKKKRRKKGGNYFARKSRQRGLDLQLCAYHFR